MRIIPPYQIARTYTQQLEGTPEEVFPLLCPVRECEWVNGWEPSLVVTASGAAELGCAFLSGPDDHPSIWVTTRYEPPERIEFIKVTPEETVGRVAIILRADGQGGSLADITYGYLAITGRGRSVVDEFTEEHFTAFMQEWETELNHFLRTGSKRPAMRA